MWEFPSKPKPAKDPNRLKTSGGEGKASPSPPSHPCLEPADMEPHELPPWGGDEANCPQIAVPKSMAASPWLAQKAASRLVPRHLLALKPAR